MDLALLVRQDMVTKAGDPFSHAISATFIQYHNSAEVSIKKSGFDTSVGFFFSPLMSGIYISSSKKKIM